MRRLQKALELNYAEEFKINKRITGKKFNREYKII